MNKVFIDFETRGTVDLKAVGAYKYARDPQTSVLCMAWAVDKGPVEVWFRGEPFPDKLRLVIAAGCEIHAWNAQFERLIWTNCQVAQLGWPEVKFEQWRCTAAKSAHASHPRALDAAVRLIHPVIEGKDKEGERLMRRMSRPQKWTKKEIKQGCSGIKWIEDSASLIRLGEYCKQDVVIERVMDVSLPDWPAAEVAVWQMNERINDRGVPFDRPLCVRANAVLEQTTKNLSTRISAATDGAITTGDQIARIKQYVNERGVNVDSLAADIIEWLLDGKSPYEITEEVRDVLQLRQVAAGKAAKKYRAALHVIEPDDRGRGLFMYYGAPATGRFASLKTQIQNMKHGSDRTETFRDAVVHGSPGVTDLLYGDNIIAELGRNVRSLVYAPEGYTLVRCDSSQIECRVLHWLANSQKMLNQFRAGLDPYVKLAEKVYTKPVTSKDSERQVGKVAVLGLGFGMGATKFQAQVHEKAKQVITEKFAKKVITTYRKDNPLIPKFWDTLEAAARACITRRSSIRVGHLTFGMWGDYLVLRLPSGRRLFYYQPEFIGSGRNLRLRYTSDRGVREKWAGGLLCENATQAVARDTLVYYMRLAEERGLTVVAHIHDELMCLAKLDEVEQVKHALLDCFAQSLPWMEGLPCAAEAKVWRRYA